MDLVKKIKLWRGIGQILNTKMRPKLLANWQQTFTASDLGGI
ncbi:hypothetical protein D1BOALGB6SA_5417 [Olavius sp. associated proteobacterium Delta 1]|nr:hypothetical protein D1BOALGB6SA_5417 [Olavius sp. associated proteobacterium Delta 1]